MASPNKDMKTGSYSQGFEGGVGGYESYKMKGHELPGPNQRTPATLKAFGTKDSDMPDGVSTSPGKFLGGLFGGGGGGGGFGGGALDKLKAKVQAKKIKKQQGAFAAGGGTELEARVAALEEAASGGAAADVAEPNVVKPDMANKPAKPVRVVQGGGTGDGTGLGDGAGFNVMSDIRAKEKIERTGESPSGIPTYEFNYIGDDNRYSGVMAQDLLEMNIDAVSIDDDGFYRVNYNNIDVDMRLIN